MRNAKGFTLVELMIAATIGSIVLTAVGAVWLGVSKSQAGAWAMNQEMSFRDGLFRAMASDPAWKNTLQAAVNLPKMNCLAKQTPCTTNGNPNGPPIQNQLFALYDSNNQLIFDSSNLANGITASGTLCTGFSLQRGNDKCPFRFDMKWSANCTPGNCVNPIVKITALLLYSPAQSQYTLSPNRYSLLEVFRNPGFSVPPSCQPLTQIPNHNNFTVSWIAGSGNGGPGGCAIQYQKDNASWATVATPATVNCDAAGGAEGTITVPGDGWLGGPWNANVAVRLIRLSDNAVMCVPATMGNLTCSKIAGSPTSTPLIDEDCDNQWDNSVTTGGGGGGATTCAIAVSLIPGVPYTCPPPSPAPAACDQSYTYTFNDVEWGVGATTSYAGATCTGPPVTHSGLVAASPSLTGVVPSFANQYPGVSMYAPPGTCVIYAGTAVSLDSSGPVWTSRGSCIYSGTSSGSPTTLYY